MNILETVNALMEGFKEYDPVNVEYGKDQVVGFPNDLNGCDLVVYVKKEELTLTYGYHHAHFAVDDIESCLIHGKKLLSGEYASVEYFADGKDLFGGARLSSTCNFNTVEDVVNCYSVGNEKVAQGLYELIKRGDVNVRAVSFDNKVNTIVNARYVNKEFVLEKIK